MQTDDPRPLDQPLDTAAVELEGVADVVDECIAVARQCFNGVCLAPLDHVDAERVCGCVEKGQVLGANHHHLVALREQLWHDELRHTANRRSDNRRGKQGQLHDSSLSMVLGQVIPMLVHTARAAWPSSAARPP